MNLYLAVVLALGSVCAVRGGTDCSLSYSDRWIDYGREVSVECPISNPNWWVITDPCKPENANQLSGCSDTFCMVESAVYLTEEFYIVCCTGSSVNRFSTDVDYSCEIIRECPVILVTTPTQAATGSSVNIQTEITSKIHPQNDSVTVMASHVGVAGGTFTNLNVLTDGANYPVPLTANNYTFFHSFPVPASAVTGDFVQIVVDVSKIPHGRQCVYTNSVARHTTFIQVGNSGAVGSTTDNNEALATQCLNGGLSNDYGFALEYISAGIGASIGVGATILVLLLITAVLLFVKHRCRSLKRPPHPCNDHMLLGTAANTPSSSEADRKLDFSSSQDTPATTPTEDDALLNQHLPSPSPPSDPGSSYASIKTKGPCPSYSVVMTGNASSALITGTSPPPYPPSKMTSTRISHAVPSASLQLTTQQHCSELRPCTLEPSSLPSQHPPPHAGYHTQGEAIFLTKKYVNGQEAYI